MQKEGVAMPVQTGTEKKKGSGSSVNMPGLPSILSWCLGVLVVD
jgi:hypothetical protein